MSRYSEYLIDIKDREKLGLKPKPIDDGLLLSEIISNIKDLNNKERSKSLQFFIYNVLPGTTSAANVKSKFLKEIITGNIEVEEISTDFAYELLSHMKGGPSIEVLLDLAKTQKVDLAEISITKLADQFLEFIKERKLNQFTLKNLLINLALLR